VPGSYTESETNRRYRGSNIIALPFRRTHHVSLSEAIKQYISTKYDQHPDMFKADLETIDELRYAAAHAQEPHVSGIKKLQSYAAQLVWIGGKFPVDIGVEFPWYPALGYNTSRVQSQNNLRFELANILYNLAAMYSQLAFSSNRSTADGLKTACNYFSFAAGALKHLRENIVPDMRSTPPEDMDVMTMECLEQLMLAQAQELFWMKAVKDGLKDASIAKLAAKVSDLYSDAGDFGIKSDAINSEWIHHMNAKHHHFAAAAQFRAACDCLEKRKYGEEVARLKDSLVCVNEALKESKYLTKTVLGDLNGLKSRVQEDLRRAEKDNDMIYLLPVPPKPELRILDRASMVSAKVPSEVSDPLSHLSENSGDLGRPLFTKLVPYAVHVAASLYEDRKNRLINNGIIDELENLTARIHDILKSLNLPGSLQALEKPLGLPPGLVTHAEEIRQQDGINRIERAVRETEKLKESDNAIYREGIDMLQTEAAEDERAQRKYGTDRWPRATSKGAAPKLWEQIHEIEGYLKGAESSDETVRKKIADNETLIRLLGGTDRDLEHFVPSARRAVLTPAMDQAANRLRACLNDISRLESRRRRKIESLRQKARQDDINPDLLKETARLERQYPMQKIEAAQFEEFFEHRLQMYKPDKTMISEEETEQQALINRVQQTNAEFVKARKGDTSTKDREKALQSLENAYYKYKEIINNLDAGRKFYNDLAKIAARFRDDCRTFAYQRRGEAAQLEMDITSGMQNLNLDQAQNLQQQKQQQQTYQAPIAQMQPPQEPMPAPQPQRAAGMWTPEMPIKFQIGGAPAGQQNGVQANMGQKMDGRWDPSKGMRFG
jgi:programmed cell death 6-interacting protein